MLSDDVVGATMAGPGIRYWELSKALSRRHQVVLAAPLSSGSLPSTSDDFRVVERRTTKVTELIEPADVVVCQTVGPRLLRSIRRAGTRLILDSYDPILLEGFEIFREENPRLQSTISSYFVTKQNLGLRVADSVICASPRQRDLWLGNLMAIGAIDVASYAVDPTLAGLVGIVPFGIPDNEPVRTGQGPRERYGFADTDVVLLWGGGVWNWLDPLTVVSAVERLVKQSLPVRLVFMGVKHPNVAVGEMTMTQRLVEAVQRSGLEGRHIFIHDGWVPYAERQSWLLDADIGISAHMDHIEAQYSFRTRVLDYLWAGLPVVVTRGDAMGDLVVSEELGAAIAAEDVDAWTDALTRLVDDHVLRARFRDRVLIARERYRWAAIGDALDDVVSFAVTRSPSRSSKLVALELLRLYRARLRTARARGIAGSLRSYMRRKRFERQAT